jgi:ATP-binding cassette subfamily B protein
VAIETQEDVLGRGYDPALMRRMLGYLRPYRGPVAMAVALLIVNALLALVGPVLTRQVLDVAVPQRDIALLGTLAGLYLAALLLEFGTEYAQGILTTFIGQRVMRDLRLEIFGRLQRLSIPYFDRRPVGRLMTRVTSDVETLNDLFSSGVVAIFGDLFTLIAIMILMLVADWRLALVAFSVIPLVWLVATLFRRSVREAFREIRVRVARLNSYLQEQLSGMRVVQLFGRESASAQGFDQANRGHLEAQLRSITVYAIFFPVIEVLGAIAVALLLWYGGLRSLAGTLTVGTLAAFIQLTRRFFQPLQDLSEKFNIMQSAMASSERIFRLLDEPVTVADPVRPAALPHPVRGEVRFEGVWFRYDPAGPWVLEDVSFTAAPGDDRAGGPHRGGEDHHHQPAAPVLRSRSAAGSRSTASICGSSGRRSATLDRLCAAGSLPVHRRYPAQPATRRAHSPRAGRGSRDAGGSRSLHRPAPGRLWPRARGTGQVPQRGGAAAPQLRAGPGARSPDPAAR